MADNKNTSPDKVTSADNKTGGEGGAASTAGAAAATGGATGGNQPMAPAPESIKTGQVPGGATTQQNLNPAPAPANAQTPVVQKDFPSPADSANDVVSRKIGGDDVADDELKQALQTRPVTDGELRRAMTAEDGPDEWPRPMVLVRGKHDGVEYGTEERVSGVAGDGTIFAISKKGFEIFGDRFALPNDDQMRQAEKAYRAKQKAKKSADSDDD
jgi:hypothetical protein